MERLDRIVKFAQIVPFTIIDQVGRPIARLYALDCDGALWISNEDGQGWSRVAQPPDSTGNPAYNMTRGKAASG